jgi:hypothetical protein
MFFLATLGLGWLPLTASAASDELLFAVNEQTGQFESKPNMTFKHHYPATKIMFIPDKECNHPDILATCGDYLRLWKIGDEGVTLHKMLNNVCAQRLS